MCANKSAVANAYGLVWVWGSRDLTAHAYKLTTPALVVGPGIGPDGHRRVALFGHSRLGKTALFAAAMDDRFAMVVGCKSGTGGAAPWRVGSAVSSFRTEVPTVEDIGSITRRFGYWFCPALRDNPGAPPVEQSELLALCAPAPSLAVERH
jgi:hypothetical protein